jgi:hypothetical protein
MSDTHTYTIHPYSTDSPVLAEAGQLGLCTITSLTTWYCPGGVTFGLALHARSNRKHTWASIGVRSPLSESGYLVILRMLVAIIYF